MTMPLLHPEANAILTKINKEGINFFYHFTSVENLPLIYQRDALCSKDVLTREGKWPPPIPGGNALSHNLDHFNGNWNKVSLSFTPYTPMAYRKKREEHLCYLLISTEAAAWKDVVFTDSNAAGTNNQLRGEGLEGLNNIRFEFIRSVQPWSQDWKRYVQAEILVPESIALQFISKIAFVSEASMQHAARICVAESEILLSVEETLFTDSPKALKEAIGFSYVIKYMLTDTNIDKNVLYLPHIQNKNIFSKSRDRFVVLTTLVKAIAGAKAKIFLSALSDSKNTKRLVDVAEFETSNRYRHQHQISLSDLSIGAYLLEYYLNDLCWASVSLEVTR